MKQTIYEFITMLVLFVSIVSVWGVISSGIWEHAMTRIEKATTEEERAGRRFAASFMVATVTAFGIALIYIGWQAVTR